MSRTNLGPVGDKVTMTQTHRDRYIMARWNRFLDSYTNDEHSLRIKVNRFLEILKEEEEFFRTSMPWFD